MTNNQRRAGRELPLSKKQLQALELEVFEPQLPVPVVAERLGIKPATLYEWHTYPLYKEEKDKMLKDKFAAYEALAMEGLENLLMENEWQAIKYVLDGNGYSSPTKLEVSTEDTIKITIE